MFPFSISLSPLRRNRNWPLPSSNNNVAFVLPSQYRPPTFGPPEADMIVLGTRVQRLSKLKSALWVRFLSPPSYKDKKLASQLRGYKASALSTQLGTS
jgi:hypothetical protein